MKKTKNIKKFTLVEMIAVVAIASVLIAVFVPSFNRMMFGSKVDQAASNFKLGLGMAQSKAIASRKYVAMMIPLERSKVTSRMRKYCLGGYRLAYVKKDGNTYKFVSWVPDSSWRNPDDGARLVLIDTGKDWNALPVSGDVPDTEKLLPKKIDTALITVDPDGAGSNDEDVQSIQNDFRAIVFSPYGGIMNDTLTPFRFYFLETKNDGNDLQYPNPDNMLQVSLNPITGKVSYLSEE